MSSNVLKMQRDENDIPKNYQAKITKVVNEQFEKLRKNICKRVLDEIILTDDKDCQILNNNMNFHPDFSCCICKEKGIYGNVYQCLICDDEHLLCEKCSNKHEAEHPMIKIC